jgi:hypothetical protein
MRSSLVGKGACLFVAVLWCGCQTTGTTQPKAASPAAKKTPISPNSALQVINALTSRLDELGKECKPASDITVGSCSYQNCSDFSLDDCCANKVTNYWCRSLNGTWTPNGTCAQSGCRAVGLCD